MTKVNLQILKDKKVILTSRIYNGLGVEQLIMIPISDENECILDAIMGNTEGVHDIIHETNIQDYKLSKNNILAYGHINLKDNSKDFLSLETLKLNNFKTP